MTLARQRSDSLTVREVDGELLILDIAANRIHQLNRTATLIWHCCGTAKSVEEIAERLAAEFDVDLDTALADVRRILHGMREAGLLAPG